MPNWKKIIVSGSDASLSSLYIDGNLTASAAFLTSASIGHLETIYETASVIYSSGSTKFGDTSDDIHEITGSLLISGGISVVEGAQLTGTSSFAITASHALNVPDTASHALTSVTSSHTSGTASIADLATTASQADNATTSSFAITASHALNVPSTASHALTSVTASHTAGTASIADFATTASHVIPGSTNSGSFSGSFQGDGSGLTGITVASSTLASASFSSVSSYTASHALDSTELTVTVYDNDNNQILPENIRILDSANVGLDFGGTTVSGKVVLAKGGHIVSGTISIVSESLVTDTFNASSYTASHTLGTRDVNVTVYDNDYNLILPENIRILDDSNVGLDFGGNTVAGNIVITKGGHIVSGSSPSASHAETASFVETAQTASYGNSFTASNLYVEGTASITFLESVYETSSIIYTSGSTKFGDDTSDIHERTGSLMTSGSLSVTGSANLVASQSLNNRDNSGLSYWAGSQAQYDALGSYDSNTIYFVT